MRALLLTFLIILTACGPDHSSLQERVRSYGATEFCDEVLRFAIEEKVPPQITERFSPQSVRLYMNGVLLVYVDNEKSVSGIYVDRERIGATSGSGLSIERWGDRVGWLEDKKRTPIK